ncbi:MAG TPA: ATP-binding protein [Bacteroidales bacterium]
MIKIKADSISIVVKDTSIGINKKDAPKLYRIDMQHTTIGTEGETGSRLGLLLCKELMEKNQGKIWVESEPFKGSSFTFVLPKNSSDE